MYQLGRHQELVRRIAAAANLGRAGLKDDARTRFNWLQKNVKDAEKLELIRREMRKL